MRKKKDLLEKVSYWFSTGILKKPKTKPNNIVTIKIKKRNFLLYT